VTPDDLALCARAPLLAGLGPDDLGLLLDGARIVSYPDPAPLFTQGDPADRFFIVLAGRATLFILTEAGERSVIELFDPVCTFAEAAILSSGRFPLHCEVSAGARMVHIPAGPFLRRLEERPALGLALLAALARWRSRLADEIAGLKGRSPAQRLAAFLLGLAPPGADVGRVRLPLTKTVLASRIGIAPESLSRALIRLKPLGVEVLGREIVLTDLDALRRFSGDEEAL
jgi:CRP-like cAMP-binding protein